MNAACNNPIVGKGVVVDKFTGGLAGLLTTNPAYEHIIDGDLTNYAEIGLTSVTGVGTVSLVSVKDMDNTYPAGRRTGFVIEILNSLGGLLGADVLNGLQIRTYLNNTLQETASVGGGGPPISLSLLSGAGKKRRVDFLSTLPFDEVELVFTGVASSSLLSTFRIFYAYEEPDGCDYDCATAINTTNFPGASSSTCTVLLCPMFANAGNVANSDTTDFAVRTFLLLEQPFIDVNANTTIAAGNDVGFVIEQVGLLGLLSVDVLSNITITTRTAGGTVIETFAANSALANVGVLPNGRSVISFKTNLPFNRVRITFNVTLSLLNTYRVYYAFVRYDADGDGYPDCVDKCPGGDDNYDADGDGIPNACDTPPCDLSVGIDLNVCTDTDMAQLPAAGPGQTWTALPGNPSAALINSNGAVSGLEAEGVYEFELSEGACSKIVRISYFTSPASTLCNDPISGPNAMVGATPGCELCNSPNAGNLIDGDLSNFVSYGNLLALSLLGFNTPLISVKDNIETYPAGTRVGYAVSFPGGVLSLGLADAFLLRTYLNGTLVETASTSGNVLGVDGLGIGGGVQRIYFEATQPFNEVELVIAGGVVSLDLITNIRIYYAFVEDAATCAASLGGGPDGDCSVRLTTDSDLCGMINYERSGIDGIACVGCLVESLSHIVDDDTDNFASIFLTTGALGDVLISVKTAEVIPAGSEAGYAISIDPGFLGVGALSNFTINTYLNGSLQQSFATNNPLVSVTLIGGAADINLVGFTTNLPYNEIQLVIDATVASVSVGGGTIKVYYAYFSRDSDGDGTPDCRDKCCLGSDFLDADGDGLPDACEILADIVANDDMYGPVNGYTGDPNVDNVLDNDTYNGAPADLADVTLTVLTPAMPVNPGDPVPFIDPATGILSVPPGTPAGTYTIVYQICENQNLNNCDDAEVTVEVAAPGIVANDDMYGPLNGYTGDPNVGNVLANDTYNDAPADLADVTLTVLTPATPVNPGDPVPAIDPATGIVSVPPGTPAGIYIIVYQVCDNLNPANCDDAEVTVEVAPPPIVAINDIIGPVDGILGDPNAGNVMGNDLLNDDPVNPSEVTASVVTPATPVNPGDPVPVLDPATGVVSVPPGTPTGMYTIVYELCENLNPANCSTASITVNVQSCVTLEAWVYLEGAAVAADGTESYSLPMRNTLNTLRILPGQTYDDFFFGTVYSPPGQPYSIAPWNYAGTEGNVYDSGGDPMSGSAGYAPTVVDWVLVSLRMNPAGMGGPLCQAAALLYNDGTIELASGFSCCNLSLSGSYYLVVEHRNHLIVMSHEPVPIVNGVLTYDFRNKQSYINDPFMFGIFSGQKQVLPGVYAMLAGNGNQAQTATSDTDINFDDRSFWESESGIFGQYRIGDYNLNGDANFNDRLLWEFNNGRFTSVPRH